ncbi:MAG TPA: glycosyltransferase family 2 protein, partial [Polyangiaceae bacterium]
MKRRTSPARRAALGAVGLLPLVGALISIFWMLLIRARPETWAAALAVIESWLLGCVTSLLGAIVLMQALYTGLQSLLWQRYRPFKRPKRPVWPRVSVVIPAFNEGPMVERSIRSVTKSNYPIDRLEIIVVDDGSRDDTFFHMQRLRREFPSLVRLIRFSSNRGKRAALEAGFRDATGEIVVTIDSDSEVEPRTIAEMVTPFLVDPQVGGVAGRVTVLNRDTTISRMLEVQYALAFDFGRAAQSAY